MLNCRLAPLSIEHPILSTAISRIDVKTLTSAERRALRARAHALHPTVMIGNARLTPAVMKEIDLALKSHELIKIRVLGNDRGSREDALQRICEALDAAPVQSIGKILVVFRPRPEEPQTPPAGSTGERRKKKGERRQGLPKRERR